MRRAASLALATMLLVPAAAPLRAQSATGSGSLRPDLFQDTTTPPAPGLRPLRVAKWGTLALATAAGVFGFIENARADDRFAELESLCEAQRAECLRRTPDGAYQSESFESLFQKVRRHDRRAHAALVAGQVSVAASVLLFLLDLGNVRPPDDIPWVPVGVRMRQTSRGLEIGARLRRD